MIRTCNFLRNELFVHLPQHQLPVAQQDGAFGFGIEFRFDSYPRPPQHYRRVLESPVNTDPAVLPRLKNNLAEAFDMASRIPVLEKLAREYVPATRDPSLSEYRINN